MQTMLTRSGKRVRNSWESRFRDSPITFSRIISCEGTVNEDIRYRNSYCAVMVSIVQDLGSMNPNSWQSWWTAWPADASPQGLQRLREPRFQELSQLGGRLNCGMGSNSLNAEVNA